VAGTLGVLSMAATNGLVDLAEAFEHIRRTSFHYQQETYGSIARRKVEKPYSELRRNVVL
jgi:hypothetical protein